MYISTYRLQSADWHTLSWREIIKYDDDRILSQAYF